jgi:hypothetical protein
MKAGLTSRIASILLLILAVGHTLGFRRADSKWGADSLLSTMRSLRFDVQGFTRTYCDFFVGSGFIISAFLVFSAVFAWQLGGLPRETLARMRGPAWALVACFFVITIVSWRYFFLTPLIVSIAITLCLVVAACLSET